MKKLFTIALSLVLTFSLAACGCQAQETTPATTVPATTAPATTAPTTEPAPTVTVPPMETNIPDPSVDTSMPDMTEDATGDTAGNKDDVSGNSDIAENTDPSDANQERRITGGSGMGTMGR